LIVVKAATRLCVPDSRAGNASVLAGPLEMAGEAYARMLSGNAQFRVVLTM
jgi:hypothetical protein